jgi:hypothetical protein
MLGPSRLRVGSDCARRLQPHEGGNDQSDADEDGNQYQAPRVVRKGSLGGGSSCHGKSLSVAAASVWHAAVGFPENSMVSRPAVTHHALK